MLLMMEFCYDIVEKFSAVTDGSKTKMYFLMLLLQLLIKLWTLHGS